MLMSTLSEWVYRLSIQLCRLPPFLSKYSCFDCLNCLNVYLDQCCQIQIFKNPQFSHQKSAKICIPKYGCQMKASGNLNAKTTIKGLYKAAFSQIIQEFEKIFKLFKCYLAPLTLRWYNKLWTELWCLEVGQRCEKKIVWRAGLSSQPAASQLT